MIQSLNPRQSSGIDDLIAQRGRDPSAPPSCVAADDATRRKYAGHSSIELWKLVLLHSRADPDWLGDYSACCVFRRRHRPSAIGAAMAQLLHGTPPEPSTEERLCANAQRASMAVASGELGPALAAVRDGHLASEVDVDLFHAWATEVALPVIDLWPSRTGLRGEILNIPNATRLLRILREAAWFFHDECAEKSDTNWRPSNDEVSLWVQQHGVKANIANAIATIIRPDDWPRGRRRAAAPPR